MRFVPALRLSLALGLPTTANAKGRHGGSSHAHSRPRNQQFQYSRSTRLPRHELARAYHAIRPPEPLGPSTADHHRIGVPDDPEFDSSLCLSTRSEGEESASVAY